MRVLWALPLAVAALAGCVGGDDDEPVRYSTWPIMSMEILDVEPDNQTRACPFPYEHLSACQEVRIRVALENLHEDLPVCLCDVWVVASASDGNRLQAVRHSDLGEGLEGGDGVTGWHTWSTPPRVALDRLVLEHVRPYYDSHGATPVRVIADLEVPPY